MSQLPNTNALQSEARLSTSLADWNDTTTNYPRVNNLQELVELQVARTPDGIAVECESSEIGVAAQISYRELNAKANQIAHHLRALGIGPDSIVGICADRSIELTIGVLGIIKAGAAYVPFDPGYPKDRLEFMIADTSAPVILTQEKWRDKLPANTAKILCLDSDSQMFARESTSNPSSETNHDHLAYLIYTSGSTGKPKGVAMRQGPLINLLQWQLEHFSFTPAARTLQFASINFDVSFQELFSTWCAGGTLVLISEEERRDSTALLHFLQRNRVERLFLPFVALKHLADAAEREKIFPERLREVITAGEQLQITPQISHFFKKLPKCTLENQYGPSETHVVTACRLQGAPETWPPLPNIGKPISNTQIHLLNAQLQPVPIGIPGELFIGGVCLARGYLNRPELSAEKFIPNPFSKDPQARLYRTGDLASFLPEGNIEFLGRIDHQVKIRGFRIELGEIEALLSKHPEVSDAVATAHDSSSGEKQLVAYVVPSNGAIQSTELRRYLKALLPPYAIPSVFVTLPKLPLSPNGKVDRRALPAPAEVEVAQNLEQVQMPRDPLEMQITLVFEKFFKLRPIGIDVSFFEIGGDSLQALQMVLELERVTGKEIPLSILYQASTIEALARVLREQSSQSAFSSLVPLQPLGSKPPLYLIHTTPGDVLGYGNLIYHLHDQPCYGLQSLGMDREELAHTTIPGMAAYYVKLIRENQPHGPYYLGGWCYGGIIAVEMAQQLLVAGERVGPLILVETPAPAPSLKHPFYFLRRISCALNMTPGQWKNYLQAKIRYYRGIRQEQEQRYKRVEAQDNRSPDEIEKHNRFLAKLEHLYHVNMTALKGYRSSVYPGKIVLLNAAEQDPAVIHDPLYGWPGLARDIQAHIIPGDHDTILMEPHVRELAQKLAQCLRGD
ncbi:MAG: amino acid adenylation domain-containing protein [Verrucomicrobia bacterium]|nr:amino acid adenylation domain-containing protein [Verrucomicrobiota bacterium]